MGVKRLINDSLFLFTGKAPSPAGKNKRSIKFIDFHCKKGLTYDGRGFCPPSRFISTPLAEFLRAAKRQMETSQTTWR